MIVEKAEPTSIFTETLLLGVAVSILGGIVAASHVYSKERKNIPPTFDWIDFVLLVVSSSFSGIIGFLLASWKLEEENAILAIAGISAIGGYSMLVAIKDIALEAMRSRLIAADKKKPNINYHRPSKRSETTEK